MNKNDQTHILMDKKDRIEISVSVPQLNMMFDLNQPVNGQTRLLLMLINTKLRSVLSPHQAISRVTFNETEITSNKSYLDIGITNGSTVVVEIRSGNEETTKSSRSNNDLEAVLKRLMIVYNEEGMDKCLSLYKDQYMINDESASLLNSIQKSIPLNTTNENAVASGVSRFFEDIQSHDCKHEYILSIIQWYSRILQESSDSCHPILLPSILHSLNVYAGTDIALRFLQLISTIFATASPDVKACCNSPQFLHVMLKVMERSPKSSAVQLVLSLLEVWSLWNLPVFTQLGTEDIAKSLVVIVRCVEWNSNTLKQFLKVVTVLFGSEDHMLVFLKSGLFSAVKDLLNLHDAGVVLIIVSFLNHLLRYHSFHHILFITDVVGICRQQIDVFPRNSELAKNVHTLIKSLAMEDCECVYFVQNQICSIFYTNFLGLLDDVDCLLSAIGTIQHLCSKSHYVIECLSKEQLLTDVLYLTRNHPFNEELWTAVISLMELINTTPAGHAYISSKTVINELKGCQLLLGESSPVTKQSQSLLKSMNQQDKEDIGKTILNPVIPFKHYNSQGITSTIEIKNDVTSQWYALYYGKEIDLISFLLHGLILPGSGPFYASYLSALFSLLDEKTIPYLTSFLDLTDVIPCLSFVMLRHIQDDDIIQQGVHILTLLSHYPMYMTSFYYDETISLLIEIVTNYSHMISLLSDTLNILIMLSKQQSLHTRLKKSGIMRMIDCLYEIYTDDHSADLSLQEISAMSIVHPTQVATQRSSSPSVQIVHQARILEVNLGLRTVSGESEDGSLESFWIEKLIYELIHSPRNTQLHMLDQFTFLFRSEYHRLVKAFLNSMGVYSIVKLAVQNLNDKEIISKSMLLLSTVAEQKHTTRYVDLTAVSALCICVLKEYQDTVSCVVPSLMILEELNGKDSLERLKDECSVFATLLSANGGNGEVCEHVFRVLRMVCEVSHVFRLQFIQSGTIQELCRCFVNYSSRSAVLFDFCRLLIALTRETEFDNIPGRYNVIDILLKLISHNADDDSSLCAILSALQSVVCVSPFCISHFMKKQGLVVLSSLIDSLNDSLDVVNECCSFAFDIVSQINISKEIISTNLISHIVNTLETASHECPSQLLPCYRCLRGVSCLSIDCLKAIQTAGGIEILADGLKEKPYDPILLKEIIWCLYQCTLLPNCCTECERDDIVASLKAITVCSPPEDDYSIKFDLLMQSLTALSYASTPRKASQDRVPFDMADALKSPLVTIMSQLLQLNTITKSDLIINLKRLNTLCSSINREEFVQYGLHSILFDILARFPSDCCILSLSFSILLYLIQDDDNPITITPGYLEVIMKCIQTEEIREDVDCLFAIVQFLVATPLLDVSHYLSTSSFLSVLFEACSVAIEGDTKVNLTSSNVLIHHDSKNESQLIDIVNTESPIINPSISTITSDTDTCLTETHSTKITAMIDDLLTFALQLSSLHDFPSVPGFRSFFLQCENFIAESYLLLLKADVACRMIAGEPLLTRTAGDGIRIDISLVDYLISIIDELSVNEDDFSKICVIIQLLAQVDEYKTEFVQKNGIAVSLKCFKEYDCEEQFSLFCSCLINLISDGIGSEVIDEVVVLCVSVLQNTTSIQPIKSVFSVFNSLLKYQYNIVHLVEFKLIRQKIELLNASADEIMIVFTLLSHLLTQYQDPVIIEEVVFLLFDEVFKGYQYSFLVEMVNHLFEEFSGNAFILSLFDKYIPDAYQNALLNAFNHNDNINPVCDLICAYLFCDDNCENMIDYGLIDLLRTQLSAVVSNEKKSIAILHILNQLIQFDRSRSILLEDRDLCEELRKWLLQVASSSEEDSAVLRTVYNCFINGNYSQQPVIIITVNPMDYDFGEPPSYNPPME